MQTDLGRRKVDESEGRLWAETKGFHYFETSAQSNINVQEMFEMLVKSIVGVVTSKDHPGGRVKLELGYTPEQATLVTKIRSCHDNYEILNVSRGCSRLVDMSFPPNHFCPTFLPSTLLFRHNTVALDFHYWRWSVLSYFHRDEINKSYKQLAVLLHPDKNLAPGSEEAFKKIAQAREELLRTR